MPSTLKSDCAQKILNIALSCNCFFFNYYDLQLINLCSFKPNNCCEKSNFEVFLINFVTL